MWYTGEHTSVEVQNNKHVEHKPLAMEYKPGSINSYAATLCMAA
jgi:hypothetical protein